MHSEVIILIGRNFFLSILKFQFGQSCNIWWHIKRYIDMYLNFVGKTLPEPTLRRSFRSTWRWGSS